jgi:hypothetical protein
MEEVDLSLPWTAWLVIAIEMCALAGQCLVIVLVLTL